MKTKIYTMQFKLKSITLIFMVLLAQISTAQHKTEDIVNSKKIIYKSDVLNEERILLISLPPNFNDTDNKYPVLFLLDGRNHFAQATGAVEYLSGKGYCAQMIIVAIVNVDRNRDFTPSFNGQKPTGGGNIFHEFLADELIPYIEENYNASGYNILMGHSLGGMFAAYSLLEYPGVFDSYIVASPYMQYHDKYVIKLAKTKLRGKYKNIPSFYMSVGEETNYFEPLSEFETLINENSADAVNFKYVKMEGENHSTTPYLTVFKGLRFIFSDWLLPQSVIIKGISAIDEHFAKLSTKYGYLIETPENTINRIGYSYLQIENYEKAIEVFKENVKRFPNSANVYDSLGEAYEKSKKFKSAVKNYQKAYNLGKEQTHRFTDVYKTNLNRAENLMNE